MLRIALAASLALVSPYIAAAADWGMVNLDNSTFPRLVDGSRAVFVRFDREVTSITPRSTQLAR
jgi:hypothetical protein